MYSQTPNNAAVTALNSADTPQQPNTDLLLQYYLAQHYAYCDTYYCSHPGPTLPNRMYSLTGDVQYDRLGVPILENFPDNSDNFLLSRALTIYDALSRRGVRWRVYESAPSLTMLRLFARYATNHTEIVDVENLEADIARGDLPEFTAIDPRMHTHPPNDDHPPADMWRGQLFLKRVYDALRSNREIWQNTLLLITYDEHGGFYDHVVPPVADLLNVAPDTRPPQKGPAPLGGGLGFPQESAMGGGGPSGRVMGTKPEVAVPYGVRVPMFVVSPWTMPGKGPSITLDHCSIVKTVLARFAGEHRPFLSSRVAASHSFESYLTAQQPRLDVPDAKPLAELPIEAPLVMPGGSAIITAPLSRKRMRQGMVDYHELTRSSP
jgi:phospholipase C